MSLIDKTARKAYMRQYHLDNREKIIQRSREYYLVHADEIDEYQRRYAKANQDRIIQHKKKWWSDPANREQTKLRARECRRATKREVFEHYGGVICACCGEIEVDLLTLDHVNNDGNAHRKQMKEYTGEKTYRWARKNNWPPLFQVLCMSCNLGKHLNGGECPHVTTRRELLAA